MLSYYIFNAIKKLKCSKERSHKKTLNVEVKTIKLVNSKFCSVELLFVNSYLKNKKNSL